MHAATQRILRPMQNTSWKRAQYAFVAFYCLLLAYIALHVPGWSFQDWVARLERHEKLAGWAQAVLAGAALVGVYLVAMYQTNAEGERVANERRLQTQSKYLATAAALNHVCAAYSVTHKVLQEEAPHWRDIFGELGQARALVDTLASAPFDLPHHDLVWKMTLLQQELRLTVVMLEGLQANFPNEHVEAVREKMQSRLEKAMQVIQWCFAEAMKISTSEESDEIV